MKPEVGKKYVVTGAYDEEWTCKYVGGSFAVLENSKGVERVPPLVTFDRYYLELPRIGTGHAFLIANGNCTSDVHLYHDHEFENALAYLRLSKYNIIAYKKFDIVEGEGLDNLPENLK